MTDQKGTITSLIDGFNQGDRLALAKIITLIESTRAQDQPAKMEILAGLDSKRCDHSIRIAVTGPPGVGKSTFINIFGKHMINEGHKLAVLPVDPSSAISYGSILGDKVRMRELSELNNVYIRPSPAKGVLGGIGSYSYDIMLACESYGFDAVIIETVGVGQSEVCASLLADHFVVLMQPGAGDQLQAMKKGILELADFILINKCDGEQKNLALQTKTSLKGVSLGRPKVYAISAQMDEGILDFLIAIKFRHKELIKSGALKRTRAAKHKELFRSALIEALAHRLADSPLVSHYARSDPYPRWITHPVEQLVDDLCRDLVAKCGK